MKALSGSILLNYLKAIFMCMIIIFTVYYGIMFSGRNNSDSITNNHLVYSNTHSLIARLRNTTLKSSTSHTLQNSELQNETTGSSKSVELISQYMTQSNFNGITNENSDLQSYAKVEDIPNPVSQMANCSAIIDGDANAIKLAKAVQSTRKPNLNEFIKLQSLVKDCSKFLQERKYILHPINKDEEEFPIAYSIIMYKDPYQVERLLRAIYRPQNLYCIHVDNKSAAYIHTVMSDIANCLDNVFLASRSINVKWGWFSVVEPEIVCMQDLLNHKRPWKYFINTCGQEFPIKTNYEVVRILKAFNGANDVQGRHSAIVPQVLSRVRYGFDNESYLSRKYLKEPFPYNVTWAKGGIHVAVTRGFVDFIINSQIGKDLINYIRDTPHASEHFFQPIHFSPWLGAPGSYKGFPDIKHDPVEGISVTRYKIWEDTHKKYKEYYCHGFFNRQICIISLGDLKAVVNSKRLFVNKFHADFHPIAYDCLEEYVFNNTRLDVMGVDRLNISFYENLDFVQHHV